MELNKILQGDCLESLKTLPDESIDMCVTSPPYYALRDYGTGKWVGGDQNCPHYRTSKKSDLTITGHKRMGEMNQPVGDAIYKSVCPLCGAVREDMQIGLEETPEAYIQRLADVFDEVYRVLKKDGTLWVNIGDSYNGNKVGNTNDKWDSVNTDSFEKKKWSGCKNKDLIGIPWMLAFELRKRGWYLRQDIIWDKSGCCMPESVTDRCTKAHEYIFLLSKSPKYYFNHEAIQEPCVTANIDKLSIRFGGSKYGDNNDKHFQTYSGNEWKPKTKNCQYDGQKPNSFHVNREMGGKDKRYYVRNKRDVWKVNTKPYKEAHFATYPEELIAPCILAGSKEGGIVLDPFMGSGTTAVVSKKLGRKYLGCELNPEYIKIAERRLYCLGESLFDINGGGVIEYQAIIILLKISLYLFAQFRKDL